MIESGIIQIIDLRADYLSDFYSELCQRSGISYMTEKNGVEPIPEIVFHERKELIKELSKV